MMYFEVPDDITARNPETGEEMREIKPGAKLDPVLPIESQEDKTQPFTRTFARYVMQFFLRDDRMMKVGGEFDLDLQERLMNKVIPAFRDPIVQGGKRYVGLEDDDGKRVRDIAKRPKGGFNDALLAAQFLPFHRTFEHPMGALPKLEEAAQ